MTSPEPLEGSLLHCLVAAVIYEHIELSPGGPQQDLTQAVHHDRPEQRGRYYQVTPGSLTLTFANMSRDSGGIFPNIRGSRKRSGGLEITCQK